jgi:putative sigma-54 modulation protein
MQVIVKSRHTHVPDPVKEMAQHKLEKVLRLLGKVTSLEIEFSEEHNPRISDKWTVEVTLTTKAHLLRAHASGPDPVSAVDMVVDKVEAQVKRLKGKMAARTRGSRAETLRGRPLDTPGELDPAARNGAKSPVDSLQEAEEGETGAPVISRVKRFALKPMTPEEAVLQMESLGHDFYLFVSAESAQTGVVYGRPDGTYGLIEPE